MVEIIISGIGIGIFLSFLTGPAFITLIKSSIERGFIAGVSFALGIFLCDILYISISLYGSSFISHEKRFVVPIGVLGSLVLLAIGIRFLFDKVKIAKKNTLENSKKQSSLFFIKGFLISICNPAMLLYWMGLTTGFISMHGKFELKQIIPFFGSVLLTQLLIDCTKAFYADKFSCKFNEGTLNKLNKFAGVFIIILALRIMYQIVFTHQF